MKLFAMYLPQFHTILENDNWWGKGFTEWTNVRSARPLYRGHAQPVHPMGANYYDLLHKSTVEWQTELMSRYGVDGFVYYHYWFKGKTLLEKPAENLLCWEEIKQRFFFCWANHTWYKSINGAKETLIAQCYGDRDDWERHFRYLLHFFRDERYEKKNNKPLLMVFDSVFAEKNELFAYFDSRCREEGFGGLCLIESRNYLPPKRDFANDIAECTEYVFLREPTASHQRYLIQSPFKRAGNKLRRLLVDFGVSQKPIIVSGTELINEAIRHAETNPQVLHGVWFQWDNTPRHGSRGYVITPYSKGLFFEYMDKVSSDDYLFINAWNEWAEGMMLEPTDEYGFKYLEWIAEWRKSRNT